MRWHLRRTKPPINGSKMSPKLMSSIQKSPDINTGRTGRSMDFAIMVPIPRANRGLGNTIKRNRNPSALPSPLAAWTKFMTSEQKNLKISSL